MFLQSVIAFPCVYMFMEQVRNFKCLGTMISEDAKCIDNVKGRIGMAKETFDKRNELLTKRLSKDIQKRMMKSLAWLVALYGCETWTMRKQEMDRLADFKMWIWNVDMEEDGKD